MADRVSGPLPPHRQKSDNQAVKGLDGLLKQYGHSHRHPWNRRLHRVGIPLIIASLIWIAQSQGASRAAWELFALGWVFQIAGHVIEGSRPEFLRNPIYLFIGPIYLVRQLMGRK